MGFNEFLTKLFGNKSQRDLKEITPYVEKVKAVYPSIKELSMMNCVVVLMQSNSVFKTM